MLRRLESMPYGKTDEDRWWATHGMGHAVITLREGKTGGNIDVDMHWAFLQIGGQDSMEDGVTRVERALEVHGLANRLRRFSSSTHTAQQAASALGVQLQQIAKSIVFKVSSGERAVVAVVRGDHQVNLEVLEAYIGTPVKRASKEWVEAATGFPVGGVSPIGGKEDVQVVLDDGLSKFSVLYAAAGDAHTVFQVSAGELQSMTGAPWVIDLADRTQSGDRP